MPYVLRPHLVVLGLAVLTSSVLAASAPVRLATPACPPEPEQSAPKIDGASRVEIVFALDTTGSMSGLIEGAKRKIWSIANVVAQAKPRPQIRIGLVAYRDRGDAYVTQVTPLTDDLDKMYTALMGLQAAGGGDGPESVNQALDEALNKCQWSSTADETPTLQVLYLVGDYEPHMDYKDDVKYPQSCRLAKERNVIINTIQCGNNPGATPIWKEIAAAAGGAFFQIEQSGGVKTIPTPHDDELAKLSRELEATLIDYGDAPIMLEQRAKRAAQSEVSSKAAAPAAADRVSYNISAAGARNLYGRQELVQDVTDGKVKLADVPVAHLPEQMRKMTPAEREKHVADKAAERAKIRARIGEVSKQRAAFLREAEGKAPARDSFDALVKNAIREQAAGRGIEMPKDD